MSTASPASESGSVSSNLPESRNQFFIGRRDLLQQLEQGFTNPAGRHNVQVITGKSGTGKTATSLEYAFSRQGQYDLIWFIRAETPASIGADIAKLEARLSPGAVLSTDFQGACRVVRRALHLRDRWLLIFDDASSPTDIAGCLPWGSNGHVLITSRNPNWKPLADAMPLLPWARKDSVAFLQKHFPQMRQPAIADKVAMMLSDLPMALDQAVAYIKQTGITPEKYLEAYEAQWAESLPQSKPGQQFPEATTLAWELSFKQINSTNPPAGDLLTLCAFLANEEIPFSMIEGGKEQLPRSLADQVAEPFYLNRMISLLQSLSLAHATSNSLVVHDLTAMQARERLAPEERTRWAGIAMAVAAEAFPFDSQNSDLWPRCAQALPHVLQAATYARAAEVSPQAVADLLDKAGWFLLKQAQYGHARGVLEAALQLVHEKIGPDTTKAARIANNLGRVRQKMGDAAEAMELFESAMEIDAQRYGPSTPYMATAANNFGMTLAATGQPARARERFEFALKIFTDHYGENHLKVASVLNNLGFVLAELKLPKDANDCYRRAMFIVETLHGNHPNLACIALNLGCLLRSQSQMTEAGELLDLAVQIDQESLGANHPRVAHDLGKQAQYYDDRGDHSLAIQSLERARQIIESNYGPESLLLVPYMKQLAQTLKANGDVDGAADLASRINALERKPRIDTPPIDESAVVDEVLSE